jgi:hypothetical protein
MKKKKSKETGSKLSVSSNGNRGRERNYVALGFLKKPRASPHFIFTLLEREKLEIRESI